MAQVSQPVKTCPKCYGEIGRGKPHHCTAAEAVKNLTKAALEIGANFGQSGSKSYQRVSSNLIKAAEAEQNVPRGEAMKLATGRRSPKLCTHLIIVLCYTKIVKK